jgi:hypothetical protein
VVVGGLGLQRAEAGLDAGAAQALGRDVVHVDREAQQGGQRDQIAADVAPGDRSVVRAPVIDHCFCHNLSYSFSGSAGGCLPTAWSAQRRLETVSRFKRSASTVARPMGVMPMISVVSSLQAK